MGILVAFCKMRMKKSRCCWPQEQKRARKRDACVINMERKGITQGRAVANEDCRNASIGCACAESKWCITWLRLCFVFRTPLMAVDSAGERVVAVRWPEKSSRLDCGGACVLAIRNPAAVNNCAAALPMIWIERGRCMKVKDTCSKPVLAEA